MKNFSIFTVLATLVVSSLGGLVAAPDKAAGQPKTSDEADNRPPPYLVAINEKLPGGGVALRCSGTLLTPDKVLADIACLDYYSLLEIVAGITNISDSTEKNRQVRSVKTHFLHPYAKLNNIEHQYKAIIFEVETPFEMNEHVHPAIIGSGRQADSSPNCTFSGWGRTDDNTLEFFQTRFDYVGPDACKKALSSSSHRNIILQKCYTPLNPEADELFKSLGGPLICDGNLAAQGRMEGFDFGAGIPEAYYPIMFETGPLTWWLKAIGVIG